jgi:hypothetical protein
MGLPIAPPAKPQSAIGHIYVLVNRKRLANGISPFAYIGQTVKPPFKYWGSGTLTDFKQIFNSKDCDYHVLEWCDSNLSDREIHYQQLMGIYSYCLSGHGPWANKVAVGVVCESYSESYSSVQRELGLLQPSAFRSATSKRWKEDANYREKLMQANDELWTTMFPHLPIIPRISIKARPCSLDNRALEILGVPSKLNPESGRGRRLLVAFSCSTSWEFRDRYNADPDIQVRHARYGKHPYNACLGFMVAAGWVGLGQPAP